MNTKQIEGGVKKYQRKTIIQKFKNFFASQKVNGSPNNLYVEKNVEFMRHPKNIFLLS